MKTTRALVGVAFTCCVFLSAVGSAIAQQAGFNLATWQSITVANYTVRYTGLANGWPSYHLYYQGAMLAQFPPNPLPPTCCEYTYQNVSILTTSVASDGTTVAGTLSVR